MGIGDKYFPLFTRDEIRYERTKIQKLDQEIKSLQDEKISVENQLTESESKNSDFSEELTQAYEVIRRHEEKTVELQQQVSVSDSEIQQLQQLKNDLQQELTASESNNSDLTDKLSEAHEAIRGLEENKKISLFRRTQNSRGSPTPLLRKYEVGSCVSMSSVDITFSPHK